MRLKSVTVENFKAIDKAKIDLADVTILVGQNSSGKSSFLQALHWACRCVADPKVQNNQARSVAAHALDYFPTPDAKVVGHNKELREGRGDLENISVFVTLEVDGSQNTVGRIPIKRGRNDAIQIDLRGESRLPGDLYIHLADRKKPFSAYIPGLAGIPSREEKKSRQPVFRSAASGDANSVLRNILLLIKMENESGLESLCEWASKILGPTRIEVRFDEGDNFDIEAVINTENMGAEYFAPLELAGTGALQVIQIFAYLILFRPSVLLIDEPDAHLHPDRQEKLIRAIEEAARDFDTQVILTTHSPHIIRTSSSDVRLAWLHNGGVAQNQHKIREQMGWGLLDKSTLLITEDENTPLLQEILDQWPQCSRTTAIWPVYGVENLPSAEGAKALKSILGVSKLIIHRDGDFMTKKEKDKLVSKFDDSGCDLWVTGPSDIEGYLCSREHLIDSLGISEEEAEDVLSKAWNDAKDRKKFQEKRAQINKSDRFYPGGSGTPSHEEVSRELDRDYYAGTVMGKKLLKAVAAIVHKEYKIGLPALMKLPINGEIAKDLKELLQKKS
ncbi:AAA family ATPase [Paracoccus sp. MA]|uniref:ATP-dependent nuclease n=1 Tax=Paracoccus sp. MA TaxID=2895796 RepID=UPI001E50B4F1|nr:ATP-binding protein [Paracoccus sp. MA]UFM64260.1 AAA family ATPase [Paracoccus sp. MA]